MSTYLHHFFVYIYFQELSVYESTYVNNTYTPKFRCLKTIVNVSTSHFHIYIYIHILSVNISTYVYHEHTPKFLCFKTRYPKVQRNNYLSTYLYYTLKKLTFEIIYLSYCRNILKILVFFWWYYIFPFFLFLMISTYQRLSTVYIVKNSVWKQYTKYGSFPPFLPPAYTPGPGSL